MNRESIYWFIALLTFVYILFVNRRSSLKVLIILCFYSGLTAFYGKGIENPYKIIVVVLSGYVFFRYNSLSGLYRKEKLLLYVYILFSLSFFYSAFVNSDYFNLTFSQYGKYFTSVCLFYIFSRILIKKPATFISLKKLLFSLLSIQILLTVVKIFTLGLQESIVGSMAYIGGGPATMLPVLGFVLLWMDKQGELEGKDWYYTLLLLLIGIVSFKRAILFIMPAIIFLFIYYVPRKIKPNICSSYSF